MRGSGRVGVDRGTLGGVALVWPKGAADALGDLVADVAGRQRREDEDIGVALERAVGRLLRGDRRNDGGVRGPRPGRRSRRAIRLGPQVQPRLERCRHQCLTANNRDGHTKFSLMQIKRE